MHGVERGTCAVRTVVGADHAGTDEVNQSGRAARSVSEVSAYAHSCREGPTHRSTISLVCAPVRPGPYVGAGRQECITEKAGTIAGFTIGPNGRQGAPDIVTWVLEGSAEVRRATYSFAGRRRSRDSPAGTLFAGEGVTVGDDFAAFSWGDCMPAGDLTDCTPNRPIDLGETGVHYECEIGHRASSTLAGVGSISTAEIKVRLAAMFADDNADTPSPPLPTPRGCERTEPHHITIRTDRRIWPTPRRTCPVNLNVVLLLLVLAGGIGGTAAVQAALRRGADRGRRAVFHVGG